MTIWFKKSLIRSRNWISLWIPLWKLKENFIYILKSVHRTIFDRTRWVSFRKSFQSTFAFRLKMKSYFIIHVFVLIHGSTLVHNFCFYSGHVILQPIDIWFWSCIFRNKHVFRCKAACELQSRNVKWLKDKVPFR